MTFPSRSVTLATCLLFAPVASLAEPEFYQYDMPQSDATVSTSNDGGQIDTRSPVNAGFYLGIGLADNHTDTGGITGGGSSVGLIAGYRFALNDQVFVDAEATLAKNNGSTDMGRTSFGNSATVSVGIGTYFTDRVSGSLHIGYARTKSTNTVLGSLTNEGGLFGLGLSYDVSPKDTIGLRITHAETSNAFADTEIRQIGLRYVHRF